MDIQVQKPVEEEEPQLLHQKVLVLINEENKLSLAEHKPLELG